MNLRRFSLLAFLDVLRVRLRQVSVEGRSLFLAVNAETGIGTADRFCWVGCGRSALSETPGVVGVLC